jgi:sporulation protein YlmC with PRC-barrel domain
MTAKIIGLAVAALVLSSPAIAQTAHKDGQWRSSKIIGLDVYNGAKEKVGEIDEIIIDKAGKVDQVIIGVGGFLGMGKHDVAVPMERLKFVNEADRTTNTTTNTNTNTRAPAQSNTTSGVANAPTVATTDKGAVTGEVNRQNRPMRAANEKWYPDHAVLDVSKDDLKKMPEFKYD